MLVSIVLGAIMGMLGAFGGRYARLIVARAIDIQLAFPYVLLAIAITSAISPRVPVLILLMVLAGWAGAARVVRSIALQERGKDYVKAAAVIGASPRGSRCFMFSRPSRPACRSGGDADVGDDRLRGDALVPGHGRPAADPELGRDHARRQELHDLVMVADAVSRACDLRHVAKPRADRRRAASATRPASLARRGRLMSAVLEVENLASSFPDAPVRAPSSMTYLSRWMRGRVSSSPANPVRASP